MINSPIYIDVGTVTDFIWLSAEDRSPIISLAPDSDGTGTKALRMLCLPQNFPTSTLEILVGTESSGVDLYKLWDGDGGNSGVVQIFTQTGEALGHTMRPHWTDSVKSIQFLSNVVMPSNMNCKVILQPIYKGGT